MGDQADERTVILVGTFTSPNLLSGDVSSLTAGAGMNCVLSINPEGDPESVHGSGFRGRMSVQPRKWRDRSSWLLINMSGKT